MSHGPTYTKSLTPSKLSADDAGIVVASIDTNEYSSDHPAAQWNYLKKGVMIEFRPYGLIHYEAPEPDLQLIARAPAPADRQAKSGATQRVCWTMDNRADPFRALRTGAGHGRVGANRASRETH